MLDIFVGKSFASRTLSQAYTFSQSTVVGLAVGGVETAHRISTLDTYRHGNDSCEGGRWGEWQTSDIGWWSVL